MEKYLTHPKAIKLIDQVGEYFKDLPHLPANLIDFIVKVSPFLALIGGALSVLSSISMISVVLNFSPFFKYGHYGWGSQYLAFTLITGVLQLLSGVLLLLAFKPLQKKEKIGWLYLYYTVILSIVMSLVSLTTSMSSLLYSLIWIALDLYLIYELRSSYQPAKKSKKKED